MTDGIIPFNRPAVVGRELEYIAQAVANGHISGDGPFTKRVSALLTTLTRSDPIFDSSVINASVIPSAR